MNHSTGKPTRYEAERIEAMLRLGCCCCAQLDLWNIAECQHIVEGNKRLGHWYTLPICPGHHRGVWTSEQIELIPPDLRVAISDGSKVFDPVYGSQRGLWIKVQARLELPAVWPSSKILPRRGYVETVVDLPEQPRALEVATAAPLSPVPSPGAVLSEPALALRGDETP